ncbi:MAG: Uma2 family endonuclease [Deltaproteobacteria bacterium]|nr:Uma2 family endonuclease [Deltaproteobacteria bacterium]
MSRAYLAPGQGGAPRSPSVGEWETLSPEQRAEIVASLPEHEVERSFTPDGTLHWTGQVAAWDTLRRYFDHSGRKVFLAANLAVYYPAEPSFAPDLLAVVDVEPAHRSKWVVLAEGRGIDWVLELHAQGDRRKDLVRNVAWYAQLGIPEYFLYDRGQGLLQGWHLLAATARRYERIVPQAGRLSSKLLGLELVVEGDRLRFYQGTAQLLEGPELTLRLEQLLAEQAQRVDDEARRAEEEARRAEELERLLLAEQRSRAEAEQARAELQAELERRRNGKG